MGLRKSRAALALSALALVFSGQASSETGDGEGRVYQIGQAVAIPDGDAEILLKAGIAPSRYRFERRKEGEEERRLYSRSPAETKDEIDRLEARVAAGLDSLAGRLPSLSLGDLVSQFGSPTSVTMLQSPDGFYVNAFYGSIQFFFLVNGDRVDEIRLSGSGGDRTPAADYRYKGSIGLGSEIKTVFALLGDPIQTIGYGDRPGLADRVLQAKESSTKGLRYAEGHIAYLREGVRFFIENDRVAAMFFFEPQAGSPLSSAGSENPAPARSLGASSKPALKGKAKPEIAPYDDVREKTISSLRPAPDRALIRTLWYSSSTLFPPESSALAKVVLEEGRNPGLGVWALHESGVDGRGVLVGIIDQNLPGLDHPEYAGKVRMYRDFGTRAPSNRGSMHGPAVLSLLVGEKAGTAPGAGVYYAAAPSWTGDAAYYAMALDWMVAESSKLPKGSGIRVVSVSAAPSGRGSPFTKDGEAWDAAVARAAAQGILVLDCSGETGRIGSSYYDPDEPESVRACKAGYPGMPFRDPSGDRLLAPTSFRSTAEAYVSGSESWQYTGRGGLSWGIPWAAGVLAMGWQVDPSLDSGRIMRLLEESAYRSPDGSKFIDPTAFLELVKKGVSAQ
jgi:Predicted protease